MTQNAHLVYCKTAKGIEEISGRHHGLQARQRRALILIDCAKSIGIISTAIPLPELEQTVPFLMQSGFIVLANEQEKASKQTATAHNKIILNDVNLVTPAINQNVITPPPPSTVRTLPPEVMEKVKTLMISTANTYMGLIGSEIIRRIQRCSTADQLIAAVAHWHMALRESKIGAQNAADLLEQVNAALQSNQ